MPMEDVVRSTKDSVEYLRSPEVASNDHAKMCGHQRGGLGAQMCRMFYRIWLRRGERYLAIPRNLFYSRLLNAQGIRLGAHSRIKGIGALRIGQGFKALDYLWLDAIEQDRVGRQYNPSLVIGNNVVVGYSVHIAATNSVRIGNDVLMGSRVTMTDHNHGTYKGEVQSSPHQKPADRLLTADAETVVEDNVWIGDGVVILPGSHIGTGSIIGANSVVNGAIPKDCVAAGIPAQPVRVYDQESESWRPAQWDLKTRWTVRQSHEE
jgi:acetyltransferase-like isoleucine patch superfamily enzyme